MDGVSYTFVPRHSFFFFTIFHVCAWPHNTSEKYMSDNNLTSLCQRRSTTNQKGILSKSQQMFEAKIANLTDETLLFIQARRTFWESQNRSNK